jgi:putative transposase
MPRIARVVVPRIPHHVTQRGNRRQRTFFCESDYQLYKRLMAKWTRENGVSVWAYCLMPNHVHLILSPKRPEGLARAVGEAHRRYTLIVNQRQGWQGYLWQGRFASFPMDSRHLIGAVRYVLLNPLRAGLVSDPLEWPHSSARVHLSGESDGLTDPCLMADRVGDWKELLQRHEEDDSEVYRKHRRTGRPLGTDEFVGGLERLLERPLRPRPPGRKPRSLPRSE